jgi:hypothetical protein
MPAGERGSPVRERHSALWRRLWDLLLRPLDEDAPGGGPEAPHLLLSARRPSDDSSTNQQPRPSEGGAAVIRSEPTNRHHDIRTELR